MQLQKQTNRIHTLVFAGLTALSLLFALPAQALEFRSIQVPKAIMYDAPSSEATKLFILANGYPVEIIVNLGEWIKVRDHFGALSWVQGKQLANKRTVLVVAQQADIRQSENEQSPLVATVEKDVVLELLTPEAKNGWVKVKHRDGVTGYMFATTLWGL